MLTLQTRHKVLFLSLCLCELRFARQTNRSTCFFRSLISSRRTIVIKNVAVFSCHFSISYREVHGPEQAERSSETKEHLETTVTAILLLPASTCAVLMASFCFTINPQTG